jgi:hypothetical protein
MAQINFPTQLYALAWDVFARPCTFTPLISQPGAPAYGARCYFNTRETEVLTEAGSVYSDAQTYIDILLTEFPVPPMQGDQVSIPLHQDVPGGDFEVLDLAGDGNAGGITTITLRKIVTAKPTPPP